MYFSRLRLTSSEPVGNLHSGFCRSAFVFLKMFEEFCLSMFLVFLDVIHLEFGSGGLLS